MLNELSPAQIDDLLASQNFGHLACCDGGQPYLVPMAYVFHKNFLYCQTGEGRKIELLRKNPSVCFLVTDLRDPAAWKSVLCHGTFQECEVKTITDKDVITVIKSLSDFIARKQNRLGVHVGFDVKDGHLFPIIQEGKHAILFRIQISEKTGKHPD